MKTKRLTLGRRYRKKCLRSSNTGSDPLCFGKVYDYSVDLFEQRWVLGSSARRIGVKLSRNYVLSYSALERNKKMLEWRNIKRKICNLWDILKCFELVYMLKILNNSFQNSESLRIWVETAVTIVFTCNKRRFNQIVRQSLENLEYFLFSFLSFFILFLRAGRFLIGLNISNHIRNCTFNVARHTSEFV